MATWLWILPVALIAGSVGGAVGFGSAVILVPVCSYAFGPVATVPILTIAALMGNAGRVLFSWREIDWRIVGAYSLGAVPAALIGAMLYVELDARFMQVVLGVFILLMIPAARLAQTLRWQVRRWHFLPLGAVMGLLSAVVGTVGPINAPFFLNFGLAGGAYIATEALGATLIHLTKTISYGRLAALDAAMVQAGVLIGAMLMAGAYVGKRLVARANPAQFRLLIEVMLAVAGMLMVLGFS
ncbi:MAG: sulfite exporter TauE/SafE family protein [Alphaproteobacteria bacterium]|nr:sulfite exporter TauE/SafE family protein [Alphaproteobacteria bacterium]